MTGGGSVEVLEQADVVGYLHGQIGKGSAIGAVYARLPAANRAIDDLALALARHVLQLTPRNREAAPRDKWFQAAHRLIAVNQPPLPSVYSAETNVDRLIRWVDHKCERVLIGVVPMLDEAGVRNARTAGEWMSRVSRLPTVVVHGAAVMEEVKRAAAKSAPEEKLAARLERDSDLNGLFEPNVMVLTVFQTRPRVDFVWRAGRLIVEVDGYHFHSGREQFAGDRQRDYETSATGFLTLRVTDQEILSDLELVLQKIRRCVEIRKNLFHV